MRVELIGNATMYLGDCREILPQIGQVDAVVTDPPYGLSFMGKKWDYDVPDAAIWAECLRALKPGGHLLAFAGTRTQHRMACNIEDAGFEIRDMIAWVFGSGFPKHRNALKPALEPITLARKPISGTVAENVLEHGTGGLNVDGCRVGNEELPAQQAGQAKIGTFQRDIMVTPDRIGRWPANLIHDGKEEVISQLGTASRFFYCAKASKRDRDAGLEKMHLLKQGRVCFDSKRQLGGGKLPARSGNNHPTVKPTDLMRYLCRLVTPPGGVIIDPFAGSGSTGKAAMLEGFQFIGIERDPDYFEIACARIRDVSQNPISRKA